ncbi:MAG TPA: homogentisate phytyltransferase [Flavobacteriales bacterium]|nr:homogentisate phytyltransferase [Flavobacteriales bacterium]
MNAIWKFSRPHTVIGSVISIITLYCIICENKLTSHIPLLVIALCIGVCTNVFIVGVNQIADVDIDRINKPGLPIPSGEIRIEQAGLIVALCMATSLGLSMYVSHWLFYIVFLAILIGWAYSMPPLHLKKSHVTAALAIVFVRGILINIGAFMVFNHLVNKTVFLPAHVIFLSVFITVFSVAIAWFKDLTDVKGDAVYGIKTMPLVYSVKRVFIAGNILVVVAYVLTMVFSSVELNYSISLRPVVLLVGHGVLLLLYVLNVASTNIRSARSLRTFYKRFWLFFFAEYLLYLVVYTLLLK